MSVFLTILISAIALLITFYALHRVTDIYFVESLEVISHRLRMTSDIAGATLMAMGSSAPELFTSLLALVKGIEHANLGAGTIVGSAIFNILVIVGASVMMRPTVLTWQPVVRDMSFYILSILLLYWAFQDGFITFEESIFFIVFYVVYLISLPLWRRFFPYEDQATDASPMIKEQERATHERHPLLFMLLSPVDWIIARLIPSVEKHPRLFLVTFGMSIVVIVLLSWVLVEAGVALATALGVPGVIIGLTVLAVGTSVPDMMASMIVARQGKGDMAVSNAVGSNIFDILIGLGLVWMIMIQVLGQPIPISTVNLNSSLVLLLATVSALLVVLILQRWAIGRKSGLLLIGVYLLYLVSTIAGWI
ncbi:MAG: calcium/sodium antiporter [bacterium]